MDIFLEVDEKSFAYDSVVAQNHNFYFLKAKDHFLGMNFGQAPLAIAHRLVPFSFKNIKFKSCNSSKALF